MHDFAIAAASKNNDTLHLVANETGLNEFLHTYPAHFVLAYGNNLSILSSSDWMAIVADLKCPCPSTSRLEDIVCWACGRTRYDITRGWHTNPFEFHHVSLDISDWPHAALYALPLSSRRYDWMHGITNLLNNITHDLYELLPVTAIGAKSRFKACMSACHADWSLESSLRPVNVKSFIRLSLCDDIALLFDPKNELELHWPVAPLLFHLSPRNAELMLLSSVCVYQQFAYTPFPIPFDFNSLWAARHAILSYYAFNRLPLKPSMHFMLNEAIEFATIDGTAYIKKALSTRMQMISVTVVLL